MAEETTKTETGTEQTPDYKALYEEMQGKYNSTKASLDKTSSEIADYKRKERERMTDDDKRKAEDAEREERYKAMERNLALRDYADELGDITDDKMKSNLVELFADGKILDALKAFKQYRQKERAENEKRNKDERMKQNPQATAQGVNSPVTKEEILQVKDYQERQRLIAENIHLFNK